MHRDTNTDSLQRNQPAGALGPLADVQNCGLRDRKRNAERHRFPRCSARAGFGLQPARCGEDKDDGQHFTPANGGVRPTRRKPGRERATRQRGNAHGRLFPARSQEQPGQSRKTGATEECLALDRRGKAKGRIAARPCAKARIGSSPGATRPGRHPTRRPPRAKRAPPSKATRRMAVSNDGPARTGRSKTRRDKPERT